MKLHERINCILLGTLWTLAIVLVLDFWLNTAYNFNMFSNAHWQFVANIQASHQPIASGFYIAIIIAICACIIGLYVLLRPRFRKIILTSPQPVVAPTPQQAITPTNTSAESGDTQQSTSTPIVAPQPKLQRPPHLHIQMHNTITSPKPVQAQPMPSITKNTQKEPRYTHEFREIFTKNGYRVLTPKTISGIPLSLIALGTNETLWIGACDISHEQMVNVILDFKAVFKETLEDIEIDINGFIINPSDNDTVESVLDFDSVPELSDAIDENPNEPESDADKESGNMDAFAGYIETVLTYLGNK